MRSNQLGSLFLAALLIFAPVARAQADVVGSTVADDVGNGVIEFSVDPAMDPAEVASQLQANLQLSGGATAETITVENGVAQVTFSSAAAGSTVEAMLPVEVAAALGVGVLGTGGGVSTAAIVGGGLLLVTGGIIGGLAASGAFEDDDEGTPVTGAQ